MIVEGLNRKEFLRLYWNAFEVLINDLDLPWTILKSNITLCKNGEYNPTIFKELQIAKSLGMDYTTYQITITGIMGDIYEHSETRNA